MNNMARVRWSAGGLVLAWAVSLSAAEESLTTRLPPGAVASVELSNAAVLIDRVKQSPVRKSIVDSDLYRQWANSGDGRKVRGGQAVLEGQLGMNLWEASRRILGDRGLFAIYPPDASGDKPVGVILIRLADHEVGPALKDRLEPLVPLANDKIQSRDVNGGWELTAPDGNRGWLKDRWVLVSNSAMQFEEVRRRLSDPAGESLADSAAWKKNAANSATGETELHFVINTQRIRELLSQSRLGPAKTDNPLASLLFGGLLEVGALSRDVSGGLTIHEHGFRGQIDVATELSAIDAAHTTLLATQSPGANGLAPQVPRGLGSFTLCRDWAPWYRQRDALLEAKVLPEFDKFETGLATFLPGKDFAKDVLELMSGPLSFVFAEQTYPHLPQPPGLQLPAGAVVIGMKDARRGGDVFNLFFQTVAAVTNLQAAQQARQPWVMSSEAYQGVQINFARYLDSPKGDALPAVYNALPASAVVGQHFVAASSLELCRDLVDSIQSLEKTTRTASEAVQRNTELLFDWATAARMVTANRTIIEARSVQEGKSAEQAKTERELLQGVMQSLKPLKVTTDINKTGVRLSLEGGWQ